MFFVKIRQAFCKFDASKNYTMKKLSFLSACILIVGLHISSQAQIKINNSQLNKAASTVSKTTGISTSAITNSTTKPTTVSSAVNKVTTTSSKSNLTNDEIVKGLKEALTTGTNKSSTKASAVDGFFKNSAIKLPFPPDMVMVATKLRALGMGAMVDKFILKLNRTAEDAAKQAAPIFITAITGMSFTDALSILNGSNNAATNYLDQKTNPQLKTAMKPIVQQSLNKVQLLSYWTPLASKYNAIPGIKKVNPDLNKYVTDRTISGLFKLIGNEETQIRTNSAAQTTDILKKVFGK